jgi:hypothetical protein
MTPPVPSRPRQRRVRSYPPLARHFPRQPESPPTAKGVLARCLRLGTLAQHVRAFAEIMGNRTGTTDLDGWIEKAAATGCPNSGHSGRGSGVIGRRGAGPAAQAGPAGRVTGARPHRDGDRPSAQHGQ